jgi:glucosamine--fructose-6-phosphate aminotransferase (isomerizing)
MRGNSMCGIIGYIGKRNAVPILMEGLHRVEYRGYDSAGIAIMRPGGLQVSKCKGRVRDLEAILPKRFKGTPGIAHTRWATHGEPSDENAHPHCDAANRIAVVHNGIIENAASLRARLIAEGVALRSETDTEVLAHLIAAAQTDSLADAVRQVLHGISGTYALAVLDAEHPDVIVVARNGGPVVLGVGEREMFVASDPAALVAHTRSVVHLDDGEIAVVRADGFETSTLEGGATAARRGPLIAITHPGELPVTVEGVMGVPKSEPELDPILLNIPLQLLAYHVALKKGCDIDKPRNLAKSVTVE